MTQAAMPTRDVRLIQGAVRLWRRRRKTALLVIVASIVAFIVLTGVYTVPVNQTGALFFMGKLVRDDLGPGIHFKLPPPLEQVTLMNTTEVRRMKLAGEWQETISLVTGDENIIEVDVALQYKISKYSRYLTGATDWPLILAQIASASMSELVSQMAVDEVLTTGKSKIQNKLRSLVQRILDRYDSGLTILAATIVLIRPPNEAAASFRRVADARSEKAKKVNVAEAKRNQQLSQSRGEAEKVLRQAESEANELLRRAQGDSERYLTILREYRQARQVTRTDLYIKTMESVINRARVILLDPAQQGPIDLNLFSPKQKK